MAKIITRRLPAATLVETIVAMVIILVVFGIVTTVFVQATLTTASLKKLKAVQLANIYMEQTSEEKTFFDEETTKEDYKIVRQVTAYQGHTNLWKVSIVIYDNNDQLLEQQNRLLPANK
jgi:type II secretory pathway pseudopilin PulG